MFLKRILNFLCLCSLGCTCLVTNAVAETFGNEAPCHHVAMEIGAEEQPTENCCKEKMEAWREAVQQNDGIKIDDVPVVVISPYHLALIGPQEATPYKQGAHRHKPRPPAHIYSWKTIRLIL